MEPRHQIDQCRLTDPAQPHHRCQLPNPHRERDPPEDRVDGVVILEGDIAELDPRAEWRQNPSIRAILDLGVRVQRLEDTLGGGDRLLDVGVHPAQFLHRLIHHQQPPNEGDELSWA